MPERSWGNSVGSGSGATLTLVYDGIQVSGGVARLTGARVRFYSKPGWSDSLNTIDVGGNLISAGRVHSGSLSGGTREWWIGTQDVAIRYGGTTWAEFKATVFGISFFNGDQATTTYSWSVELPARPYELPDPATGFANTFINDYRVDLSWIAHWTGGGGAKPWHNQLIQRTATGNWSDVVDVAWLGWEPTSWTDNGVQPNGRYDYRHLAINSRGVSAPAYASSAVYTTPAAPSELVATKQTDGSIRVEARNNAPWATRWQTRRSSDGTTWEEWGEGTTPTFVLTSPNTAVTHRFQMRAKTPDGKWSAWSPTSNIVALQAPPNAPAWNPIDPAFDATTAITTPWTHNPVDTTAQTAYEAQWRRSLDNGATWGAWTSTGKTASTTSSRTWAASAFPQNALVEMQVRTWGAHATASPWSASTTFRTSARPLAGISTPTAGAVLKGAVLAVKVTYSDVEGSKQSALEVALFQGATEVGRWFLPGEVTEYTAPYRLEDKKSYRVEVRVRDGVGLWSNVASSAFSVVYVSPPAGEVSVEWDTARAAAVLTIGNPLPVAGSGAPDPVYNRVYRDGVLIADHVALNATVVDPLPLIAGSKYVIETVSALPSEAHATVLLLPVPEVVRRFWLNAGPGWSLVGSFWANVKRSHTRGRKRVTEQYSGRELPVSTIGEARVSRLNLSGDLLAYEDSPNRLWEIAEATTDAVYRDRYGKWAVSLDPIDGDAANDAIVSVKVQMTEVEPAEGVVL